MADKKDNENAESPAGVPAPAVDLEATDAAPAPADEPSEVAEVPAAAPEEPVAEEPVAEAAPEEPAADAEEAPAAQEAPAEPVEALAPKERRRKARSTHSGEPAPARSPEDRHAERLAERRTKAVRRRARRLQEREKKAARRQSATDTPVAELAPVHAPAEGKRSVRQGIVVSDKADKTITVRIDFARRHRRYEKIVRSSSTLHAHDEQNDAHEGDTVRVIESRPLSKSKRWKLVDVLERAR
jgi:small subunit ribosomal protein S17